MKSTLKKYLFLISIVALVVSFDQWTKWLVRSNIPLNGSWLPDSLIWLAPYARIVFIYNKGAAFGMFQSGGLVFTIIAFLVFVGVLYFYNQIDVKDKLLQVAAGLYLSGIVGNLIDRLTQGQVTDFISVGTFYIFNIADASINVGVAFLVIGYWLSERKKSVTTSEETLSTDGKTL